MAYSGSTVGAVKAAKLWVDHNVNGATKSSWRSKNTAFSDRSYISYETRIAKFNHSPSDELYAVFDSYYENFSVSTRQHFKSAWGAIPQDIKCFIVPETDSSSWAYEKNAAYLLKQVYDEIDEDLRKWKDRWRENWWENALRLKVETYQQYCQLVGQEQVELDVEMHVRDIKQWRKAKMDAFNAPEQVEKREIARARRLALKALEIKP